MILTFRALEGPLPHWHELGRQYSPFTATYANTLTLLDRELDHLDATNVTLGVVARNGAVRLDGQLRADAKVDHPGVVLNIETRRHGELRYETDRFTATHYRGAPAEDWKHNLRAIALGLEALRKVERYGIAQAGQQYAGYKALGAGTPMPAAQMTEWTALKILGLPEAANAAEVRAAWKELAARAHPDAGGDADTFAQLTEARDLLLGAQR